MLLSFRLHCARDPILTHYSLARENAAQQMTYLKTELVPSNKNCYTKRKMRALSNKVLCGVVAAILCLTSTCVWADTSEDFAFDGAPSRDVWSGSHERVRRVWGIPDSSGSVGKLLTVTVPKDAFSGDVDHYEATGPGGGHLPRWLFFDKDSGILEGVPTGLDVGEIYVKIRAIGISGAQDSAKDVFAIDISHSPVDKQKSSCEQDADETVVSIVLDANLNKMSSRQRVDAIKNLAGFLGVKPDTITLRSQDPDEDVLADETVILAGPGNIKRQTVKQATVIEWPVGCDGEVEVKYQSVTDQLREQARDGTLAEVLVEPVVGWHIRAASPAGRRERREIGSGDDGIYDDSSYDDEEVTPESRVIPTMASPVFGEPVLSTTHPHRHHHGEKEPIVTSQIVEHHPVTSPVVSLGTILPTPVMVPVRPTRLFTSSAEIEPSRVWEEVSSTPSVTIPDFSTEVESSSTTELPTSEATEPLPSSSVSSTTEENVVTQASENGTTHQPTEEVSPSATSTGSSVIYGVKNFAPVISQRIQKLAITAGKAFRFSIPNDTFTDFEDGDTRNLILIFKTSEGKTVPINSWIQFNPETREIYALPLEEQVSRWEFILEAMDTDGDTVSDNVEIVVRQHPGQRAVNHEFTLQLKIEEKLDFPSALDWQLRVLDGLATLYGDKTVQHITVRNVTATNGNPVFFKWTNDSLPRHHCPEDEIKQLKERLTANDDGAPSTALQESLSPEFMVKKVSLDLSGACDTVKTNMPPQPPQINYPPSLRNQVDRINATAGQFLHFQVPEDLCYDPEDGNTRNLKVHLYDIHRSALSPTHWVQFDSKNQEFYGLPMQHNLGREEFQLVCEDTGGLTANDVLEIVVNPVHQAEYNVEFSMRVNTSYVHFSQSASAKRKFLEKVAYLFGDKNTSQIAVKSIAHGSVQVAWYNRSLPHDPCPNEEIIQLRKVLMNDDGVISKRVGDVMGPDFPVLDVQIVPISVCQGELTPTHVTEAPVVLDEIEPPSTSDEYFITFIVPAVIIALMLLLAGIIACVLYRKRRKGKMTMEENKTFINKGIPIIFQDELEEKPVPAKNPVIMKEEKPPLPPPEYPRSSGSPSPTTPHLDSRHVQPDEIEDTTSPPYQPPPPFTTNRDSNRQNRPKPTPTYRKPPPYVPP